MSVTANSSADGRTLTIKITDRFDFNLHGDLRRCYQNEDQSFEEFVVDLADTTYMDSSALGMLLQLRDHAGGSREAVRIVHAQPSIRDILAVANFNQLMTIE